MHFFANFFLFLISSEWFAVHSSEISHADDADAGMTGLFTVLSFSIIRNYVTIGVLWLLWSQQ